MCTLKYLSIFITIEQEQVLLIVINHNEKENLVHLCLKFFHQLHGILFMKDPNFIIPQQIKRKLRDLNLFQLALGSIPCCQT